MNREIEFRGKRLDNSEWLHGDLMHDNQGGYYIYPLDAENLYIENKVDPDTVGEFTGLHDKNGKKIYEGDIVKIPTKHGDDVFWIGYETSHIGAFCLCEDDDCNSRFVSIFGRNYDYEPFYCEVIGNIHDNPNLLSSK